MDFTQFNKLPKDTRTDVVLCALVKILTGQMTKHLDVMKHFGKDIDAFLSTYTQVIDKIASDPATTIEALRTMIDE